MLYVGHSWNGCSASVNHNGFNCLKAIDGITSVFANGWAYNVLGTSSWAIFDLTEKRKMNTIVMKLFVRTRNYLDVLLIFRVNLIVDGQSINLTGLKVQEYPSAIIDGDGTVTLATVNGNSPVLHLEFNTVSNVQSIRLDMTKTNWPPGGQLLLLHEIIPKFEHRED